MLRVSGWTLVFPRGPAIKWPLVQSVSMTAELRLTLANLDRSRLMGNGWIFCTSIYVYCYTVYTPNTYDCMRILFRCMDTLLIMHLWAMCEALTNIKQINLNFDFCAKCCVQCQIRQGNVCPCLSNPVQNTRPSYIRVLECHRTLDIIAEVCASE